MQNPRSTPWRAVTEALFEKGGAEAILKHTSNLVLATLVIAAGLHAVQKAETLRLWSVWSVRGVGGTVAALGAGLFLLNFADGLHRLARTRRPRLFSVLLVIAYVFLTLRAAQLVMAMRAADFSTP